MGKTVTLDKDQLREISMDDHELMRELVEALVEDTSKQIGLLQLAVRDGDADRCRRLAHYSKGACSNLGARSAAELLTTIEQLATQAEFAECGFALARLAMEIDLLRGEAASLGALTPLAAPAAD